MDEMLKKWGKGRCDVVSDEPKGHRDVMWCPYANEPVFLEYRDSEPHCPLCSKNFEAETHEFICHIGKP